MEVGKYIRQLRLSKDMSQEELGKLVGVQRAAVQKWECGKTQNLKRETIVALSQIFNVSPVSFVSGEKDSLPDNIIPLPKMRRIPLLGTIACGEPILATENLDGDVDIPDNIHADFALHCKGDSMINARIMDGDTVYIRQQPDVENGEIAAVLIGDEATLKRVYKGEDQVTLMPENSAYQPKVYIGEKLNDIRIIGKAVAFTSIVK